KIYGLAGLRVGYGVGPAEVVAEAAKVRRAFDVAATAQAAAMASLGDPAELERRRRANADARVQVEEILRTNGLEPAEGAVPSFGTLLATVALAVDVKDRTDSGLWVGALMIVEFLPVILIGLAFGPLLDRASRRTLMVTADVVRAAVFCALPFANSAGTIVALA